MAQDFDDVWRSYTALQPRPPEVQQWVDLEPLLIELGERLLRALGAGWKQEEGVHYEAGALQVYLAREYPEAKGCSLTASISINSDSSVGETPPEVLELELSLGEVKNRIRGKAESTIGCVAVFASAAALGGLVLRRTGSWAWAVTATAAAAVPTMVMWMLLMKTIDRLLNPNPRSTALNQDMARAVAAAERFLGATFTQWAPSADSTRRDKRGRA